MKSNNTTAIEVKNVVKSFRIPLEKGRNIKQRILGRATKGYKLFTPLNKVSFTIEKGDFFGIVGRNGSGKSTLLKTIAGIYVPDSGKVSVDGTLVPFIELGVGFNPELTGKENVYLSTALLGFSRQETDVMYDDIVDFAELHDFMEERLQNYSSGMQVRLAFSISIRAKGDILLLDEVLAVGDAAFQQKCFNYFEQLKREKKTVILVTHSMTNVERFCNKALLLDKGEVAYFGSSDETAERYRELFRHPEVATAGTVKTQSEYIKSLKVTTTQGEGQQAEIKALKDFSIKVQLSSKIAIKDPNISVTITDKKGNLLLSQDIKSKQLDIDTLNPGEPIEISYDINNIYTNGDYFVGVVIMATNQDGNRARIYDQQNLHTYTISGVKNNAHGLTHPKIRVTLKKN